MRLKRPICDAWVEAAQAAGYPFNPDYNGATQEGVGYFQLTTRNGRRCSSAVAFLNPARSRPNLTIVTRAAASRILFDGKRATGVAYRDAGGIEHTVTARAEVILSSGAIGSPQLLMVSGIGEADHLRDHGITVRHDLKAVGKNMQDHLQARLVFKCKEPTLNDEVRSLLDQARIAVEIRTPSQWPHGDGGQPCHWFHAHRRPCRHAPTFSSTFNLGPPTAPAQGCIRFLPSPCRSANCAPKAVA